MMRRLQWIKWALVGAIIGSAVLMLAFARADSPQPATGSDRWSAEELTVLASLSLKRLPPVPIDPANAVERVPAAVDLGRRLFNDPRFSSNGAVVCASCRPRTH